MQKDHFEVKSQTWDAGSERVHSTKTISEAILENFILHKEMDILDFGVGTGLLGFEIAQHVQKVYGVDTSKSMLEKLREKNTEMLSIEAIHQDIIQTPLLQSFDGLISSMTLHHVEDLHAFFTTIKNNIKENGFIAIADLESEDGTFHSDNEGVFHFGFDKNTLCALVAECGFKEVAFERINTIQKPHRDFGVFLLRATNA
ncbi:MAG: class I SAM-dependent methyltransferase [Sulfurimonas sp.]|jgi:2-polyprenyl-3-methyl-5-hydroxy-6-metoxy-1,4-benzoquinol methylase|nr:class I SAM-dependent methyltransferase [Sulfurimonas sp.]